MSTGDGLAWLGFWLFLGVGCSEIDVRVRHHEMANVPVIEETEEGRINDQ